MVLTKKIFALGFFDGVHLGHQALLTQVVQLAQAQNACPAAITFDRHPQALFAQTAPPLINTLEDRLRLLERFGAKQVAVLPTTKEVMSTSWEVFLEQLLCQGAVGFVCGTDFRFGHQGAGNSKTLQQFCQARQLPYAIVPQQRLDGIRISSTHIRKLLELGQTDDAAAFLGHPHRLSGAVSPGRQLGRTIGIPTANLAIPSGVLVPRRGVYACRAEVDAQRFVAVTNVGSRPTVGGHEVRAESWLLGFSGDLYGKNLTLEFGHFLRPEIRFDSLDALKAQIAQDARQAQLLLPQE